jgi:hypothetical protein
MDLQIAGSVTRAGAPGAKALMLKKLYRSAEALRHPKPRCATRNRAALPKTAAGEPPKAMGGA